MGIGEQFELEKTGRIDPENRRPLSREEIVSRLFQIYNSENFSQWHGSGKHLFGCEFCALMKELKD